MGAIKVSGYWLEGFMGAAEAAGIPAERVPDFFKVAQRLQLYRSNPEAFEAGAQAVMKQAAVAPVVAGRLSRLWSHLKKPLPSKLTLGLIGGALAVTGATAAAHNISKDIGDMQFQNDLSEENRLRADSETRRQQIESMPGHAARANKSLFRYG